MIDTEEVIEIENLLDINKRIVTERGYSSTRGGNPPNIESAKILNKRKKMVPLFSIGQDHNNPIITSTQGYNHTSYNVEMAYKRLGWEKYIYGYNPEKSLQSYAIHQIVPNALIALRSSMTKGLRGVRDINYAYSLKLNAMSKKDADTLLEYYIHKEREKVEDYIMGGITIDSALDGEQGTSNTMRYTRFLSNFFNAKGFTVYRTRIPGVGYVVGRYYIAEYNLSTGATSPLVCGMIEKKHIPYFKAAQVLDDPISTEYLQLWVKEGFDHKDTVHRGLRPKYRKFIKNPLALVGVDIIERPSLEDIFCIYTPPKCNSIEEYEQFLKDASKEALKSINNN